MPKRPDEILLVGNDLDLTEAISQGLTKMLRARVTTATLGADALREELTARHDLILTSLPLPDINGLAFIRELRVMNDAPIILMANHPTVDEAIEAMRLKVTDLLVKPFDLDHALSVVRRTMEQEKRRRWEQARHRRLRRVSSRVIRERRDLRQRMDLICRDFVHAYRRLASKVEQNNLLAPESCE